MTTTVSKKASINPAEFGLTTAENEVYKIVKKHQQAGRTITSGDMLSYFSPSTVLLECFSYLNSYHAFFQSFFFLRNMDFFCRPFIKIAQFDKAVNLGIHSALKII